MSVLVASSWIATLVAVSGRMGMFVPRLEAARAPPNP
jgi:hypothetical protein